MQQNYKYQNDFRLYLIIAIIMIIGAISKHGPSNKQIDELQLQSGGAEIYSLTTLYFAIVFLIIAVGIQTLQFYIKSKKVSSDGQWQKHKRISLQPEVYDHNQP